MQALFRAPVNARSPAPHFWGDGLRDAFVESVRALAVSLVVSFVRNDGGNNSQADEDTEHPNPADDFNCAHNEKARTPPEREPGFVAMSDQIVALFGQE